MVPGGTSSDGGDANGARDSIEEISSGDSSCGGSFARGALLERPLWRQRFGVLMLCRTWRGGNHGLLVRALEGTHQSDVDAKADEMDGRGGGEQRVVLCCALEEEWGEVLYA